MRKYVIILMIGAAVISMTMSASADGENPLQRIDSREVGSDNGLINEPIIEPVSYDEETGGLIIAPNPDAVIEHNAYEGERELEIQILENNEENELVDSSATYGAVKSNSETSKYGAGTQATLVVGAVIALLLAFIVLRKK